MLSMLYKRLLFVCQHLDKILHIFGQIPVLPVADIEIPVIFNAQDGIGNALGHQFRRHLNVVLRADHHRVTGDG